MTLYFREATLQEKKEDGLDYRLTEATKEIMWQREDYIEC